MSSKLVTPCHETHMLKVVILVTSCFILVTGHNNYFRSQVVTSGHMWSHWSHVVILITFGYIVMILLADITRSEIGRLRKRTCGSWSFGLSEPKLKIVSFSEVGIICHECRDSETGGLKYCGQEGVEEVETDCGQDASRNGDL